MNLNKIIQYITIYIHHGTSIILTVKNLRESAYSKIF